MQKIVPNLWFDTESEDAANFYVSIFKDSEILDISRYGEAGPRPRKGSERFELDQPASVREGGRGSVQSSW